MSEFHDREKYPHLGAVMDKMCSYVGIKWEDVDPTDKEWYLKHEWTTKEQDEFYDWMVDYLYNNAGARREILDGNSGRKLPKYRLRKAIGWFILSYGWKHK
jgi:hypothetical protein